MRIYTRSGDEGETSLFAGGRVNKDDARLHAYGTVDELNSVLGVVQTYPLDGALSAMIKRVQMELFHIGADLATPLDAEAEWVVRANKSMVNTLEHEIDMLSSQLEPLKTFIVPGGSPPAAHLHVARTVCRRAERWIVTLSHSVELSAHMVQYINRLSDWLFVMARAANQGAGVADVLWQSPRTAANDANDE